MEELQHRPKIAAQQDWDPWFLNSSILSEWKTSGSSSLLWIHGKRQFTAQRLLFLKSDGFFLSIAGAGKSVLWFVVPCVFSVSS